MDGLGLTADSKQRPRTFCTFAPSRQLAAPYRINTLAPNTTREKADAPEAYLTHSMLALLINSLGFTPGLRPAPSARSSRERERVQSQCASAT